MGRGYEHAQRSVYQKADTFAIVVWQDTMDMRSIPPLGIIPTVIKEILIYYVSDPTLVVTNGLQLGGAYSPALFGPTPVGLIPAIVPSAPMLVAPNPLPLNVCSTVASNYGPHWATW
jgi:hypothetical protein